MGLVLGLGVARCRFMKDWIILIFKNLALLKKTQNFGISIHAVLLLLSVQTSSISPHIILSVYKAIEPFPWFLIGQLVTRLVILLRPKRIIYVSNDATLRSLQEHRWKQWAFEPYFWREEEVELDTTCLYLALAKASAIWDCPSP